MAITPLPVVPNVIKLTVSCAGNDGRTAMNVFHMSYGGPGPSYDECANIAEALWNGWVANMTPLQPGQTSLVETSCTDLGSTTTATATYNNDSTPVPGTSTHGMVPFQACFVVSKFVSLRYRGARPRSYLPIGTTEDMNDDGDWKADTVTVWTASWVTIIEDLVGGSPYGSTNLALECSVSYYSAVENPTPPHRRIDPPYLVLDIPLDGYTGQTKMGTQRKRIRRVERRR
jgi:hypothetical protein